MLPAGAFGEDVMSIPIESGFFDLGFAKPERLNAGSEVEADSYQFSCRRSGSAERRYPHTEPRS